MSTITKVTAMKNRPRAAGLQVYVIGFLLSIGLTIWAYVSVVYRSFSGRWLLAWLLGLALVQFVVQLVFFLHIGAETKPRWRRLLLVLMIFFVMVVILGSIWVMYNLNYRMSPEQMNTYMLHESSGGL